MAARAGARPRLRARHRHLGGHPRRGEAVFGAPQPDEIVRARERLRRAKAGLDQLDPLTRRCLLAQRLEGVSYAEIAAREGLPLTTVEKRVARAVLFLMKWMDDW